LEEQDWKTRLENQIGRIRLKEKDWKNKIGRMMKLRITITTFTTSDGE
jgi:hypothetical protein